MTLKKAAVPKGVSSFTIIKILKTFSPKEIVEFGKLLSSPYFNNHSTLVILFNELKNHYPEFNDTVLSKEYLFTLVNKGKKYDDRLFQKYLSRLNKLAEEFLNLAEMKADKNFREINILNQLSKRELNDVYSRKINEFEKTYEKTKLNEDYYYILHKLSIIKYNHYSSENYSHLHKKEILKTYNNLIKYFVFNSANYINQLTSDRYSYNIPEELNISGAYYDINELIKNLRFLIKRTPPSDKKRLLYLDLILNDLKMNSEKDKEGMNAYRKLKELVFKNSSLISNGLLLFYVERLNVYCVLEYTGGYSGMDRELFENYNFLIDNKLFFLDDIPDLRILDFRAILNNAIRIGEIEWIEKFLIDSKSMIRKESRNNFFSYGYSVLLFYKKNYSEALDHISMIKNEPLPVTIDIYILKIKIFYELGFYDSALSYAESFRHYILGNKIISEYVENLLSNFIRYFKNILTLKKKPSDRIKNKLLFELNESNKLREKRWLLEKLGELIN